MVMLVVTTVKLILVKPCSEALFPYFVKDEAQKLLLKPLYYIPQFRLVMVVISSLSSLIYEVNTIKLAIITLIYIRG